MDDVSKLGPLWVNQLRQTVTERRNRAAESLLTINPDGDYVKHHQMLIDAADAMLNAAPVAAPAPREQDKRMARFILTQCIHNMVVANQAAWIEWQNGKGAEAAMQWIENGLVGPGHIPKADGLDAQAYFDANVDERMEPSLVTEGAL